MVEDVTLLAKIWFSFASTIDQLRTPAEAKIVHKWKRKNPFRLREGHINHFVN